MPVLKVKQLDGSWLPVGGAAVGVPVGGAQNAILSKSSATDYAVQWTTAPILTGLTVNGDATLTGTLISKHAVRAAGYVDPTTPSLYNHFGVTAVAQIATGHYRLTLATAVNNPIVVANQAGGAAHICSTNAFSATQFDVMTFTVASVAVNTYFAFMVMSA